MLNITKVTIYPVKDDERLKAYASIVIEDGFVVKDIRIIKGENNLFVAMPNKKLKDGRFADIAHPIKADVRDLIEDAILNAYEEIK